MLLQLPKWLTPSAEKMGFAKPLGVFINLIRSGYQRSLTFYVGRPITERLYGFYELVV